MKRVFIIHGWNSNPEAGWKPWLAEQLKEKGFVVYAPTMPDSLNPLKGKWIKTIAENVLTPDENCFFVGHSLGCAAILRYLETIDKKVGGCVLVAGPSDSMGFPFIKTFFETKFDWSKIKRNCGKFIVVHSNNDKTVPIAHAYVFKDNLSAELIIDHKGHFTGTEGIHKADSIINAVIKITNNNAAA
jgi:predicted alpha/beta hydrolase family esterase